MHFAEDGFRDNRAGACCVQKARLYVTSENDAPALILRMRISVYIYTQMGKYLRSQGTLRALAQVRSDW